MRRPWLAVYAVSLLIGIGLWFLAPARWDLKPVEALLIGSALYFGALHRFMARATCHGGVAQWRGRGGLLEGLLPRAALFFAIAATQTYACFVAAPYADVRGGFVLTASWLVAQALIDSPKAAIENRARSS